MKATEESLVRQAMQSAVLELGHPHLSVDAARNLIGDMSQMLINANDAAEKDYVESRMTRAAPLDGAMAE